MTDQIIREFQAYTSNPDNSDQDCYKRFEEIVGHFFNPVFMMDYNKMQIRKAAITIANNRSSVYPNVLNQLRSNHPSLFEEFKLPNA